MFGMRLSTALMLMALVFLSSKADILEPISYSLLSEVIRYLKSFPNALQFKDQLFICLTCLRAAQADGSLTYCGSWDDRFLFKLVVNLEDIPSVYEKDSQQSCILPLSTSHDEMEVVSVTTFATYMCFLPKLPFSDSLLLVETWIYLRNSLSLGLQHLDSSCTKMTGTVVNMTIVICLAMSRLLEVMDDSTRRRSIYFF